MWRAIRPQPPPLFLEIFHSETPVAAVSIARHADHEALLAAKGWAEAEAETPTSLLGLDAAAGLALALQAAVIALMSFSVAAMGMVVTVGSAADPDGLKKTAPTVLQGLAHIFAPPAPERWLVSLLGVPAFVLLAALVWRPFARNLAVAERAQVRAVRAVIDDELSRRLAMGRVTAT